MIWPKVALTTSASPGRKALRTRVCRTPWQGDPRVNIQRGARAAARRGIRRGRGEEVSPAGRPIAHDYLVLLVPDVDYQRMSSELSADLQRDPARVGAWLSDAWSEAYRSQVPDSMLLEFEEVATFLFDQAGAVDAPQADRTIAARGFSRPGHRVRDVAYQRGYPSPAGRAARPLDKGHMVAHGAGGEFGPNIFPQDRELNRGWSNEGERYRALEREIAATPGAFFFCCLLYRDDSDFPAAVELGLLRPGGLYVERFRNRFD